MEVIVAMTILSIVVTILTGIFVTNADIFRFIISSSDDIGELRLADGRITLELRSVRDRRSILRATESDIEFINIDGKRIDFSYNAGSSEITLNGNILADNMDTFRLRYFDSYGRVLTNPRTKPETNIWSVEIEMRRSGQNDLRLISRAYPRNLL